MRNAKRDRQNDICVKSIKRLSIGDQSNNTNASAESNCNIFDEDRHEDDLIYPADEEDNVDRRSKYYSRNTGSPLPDVVPFLFLHHRRKVDSVFDDIMRKSYRNSLINSSVSGTAVLDIDSSFPASVGPHPATDVRYITFGEVLARINICILRSSYHYKIHSACMYSQQQIGIIMIVLIRAMTRVV